MTTPKARKRKPATTDATKKKPAPKRKAVVKKPYVVGVLWCAVTAVLGVIGGVWAAGGVKIDPTPPQPADVLSEAYDADRASQVAILKELAAQPFDGATDDGRRQAGEWFNAQRFRNRADDFGGFTDAVSDAIAGNTEADLAAKLEAAK
jgi:hypothetical protein